MIRLINTHTLKACVSVGVLSIATLLFAVAAPAVAQTADKPAPQAQTPSAEAGTDAAATTADPASADDAPVIQATIRNVKGIVQYRTAEDQAWQKVEAGQTLDVGVEFRTGPRSEVTFHLPPDQLVTLDRLGTLKLLDALNNDQKTQATTELGMRYGRTRYQVEGAQGVEHHATIRSPNATLAIRGTEDVTLTDQGIGPAIATSRRTRVTFRIAGRSKTVAFGSKNDDATQTVSEGDDSPADYRNRVRVVDAGPTSARSISELRLLSQFELYNGTPLSSQSIRRASSLTGNSPLVSDPDCGCEEGG